MINSTVINWENGTDLVVDSAIDRRVDEVWNYIADPRLCDAWFAGYSVLEESDDHPSKVEFTLDEEEGETMIGEVLACESESHVLLDIDHFGRCGVSLTPVTEARTRITLTYTFADAADARRGLPEFGPVVESHLRMLLDALDTVDEDGRERDSVAYDITEDELYSRYEKLAKAESLSGNHHGSGNDEDDEDDTESEDGRSGFSGRGGYFDY